MKKPVKKANKLIAKASINYEVYKMLFDDIKNTPEFKKGYLEEKLKYEKRKESKN